jgi:branched-chain amino acid transport system substrate-binding protein
MKSTKSKQSSLVMPPPIVFILLGGLLLWGGYRIIRNASIATKSTEIPKQFLPENKKTVDLTNRFSWGDRLLIEDNITPEKQAGVEAMIRKDYSTAIDQFQASLTKQPNDPEARIYLNNAKAMPRNPLKLAVTVPTTTDVNLAKEVLRGVAQSQQEINDLGGVNGRRVAIVIANDDNEEKIAQQVAESFVQQSDILGVIGHISSGVTLATASIYDRGKLVAISPISSAVKLSSKSPYVLRTIPSDSVAARALANHLLTQMNRKKIVVYFNSQSDYSKSLKGEFSTAIALGGGQIVTEFDLADSSLSPSKSLEQAQQKGADSILLAANTSTLDRALQVVQANQSKLPILGGDDVYSPKTLDIGQEKSLGMVVAVPWHILGDSNSTFPLRSHKLWGGDVNWRTVTAYDACQALIAALQSPQHPTRSSVQQALISSDFQTMGATDFVKFLPSGDRNKAVQLVTVVQGNRSSYNYDFVPIP